MVGTEGLEDQLNQLLNDPDKMAQIMSMAKAFTAQAEQPSVQTTAPMMDEGMLLNLMQIMQQMQQTDAKQEALFSALKPYLAPERQEKLDRAMQIAKLSHLAGYALRNTDLFGK